MTVVNVKVKYIRPTYNTLYDWMKNPEHEYTKTLLAAIPQPNPDGRDERIKKRQELTS